MDRCRIEGNQFVVEPGCLLGPIIDVLSKHRKVVPHGDCFGVGAGGHFLTAGGDLLLTRLYGLGCQSVVGGRVVLWDGTAVDVDQDRNSDLLYAFRGGAAAGVGVVTEIRLQLQEEPCSAMWKFPPSRRDRWVCVCVCGAQSFVKAHRLPHEILVSFRL